MALRRQFQRPGGPLHTRRQVGAIRGDVVEAGEVPTVDTKRTFEETAGPVDLTDAAEA
jgi:hypothetical protein